MRGRSVVFIAGVVLTAAGAHFAPAALGMPVEAVQNGMTLGLAPALALFLWWIW